jgi:hypothetical protein
VRQNTNHLSRLGDAVRGVLPKGKQLGVAGAIVVAVASLSACGGSSKAPSKPVDAAPPPSVSEPPPQVSESNSRAAALATVRSQGFVSNGSTYHPEHQLRVITAVRDSSVTGTEQQAFFFVGDRYIGTDSKEPSAGITMLSQDDTTVTLNYPRYQSQDPMCCASEGFAMVRYHWDGKSSQALDPVPPSDPFVDGSRR